ncbi:MAG: phosphoribosylanthranilate isomerase [Steroidobacteraceae bacterium]
MSRLWIKVCGLGTREAVEAAVEAGADAVGFVFHPASPRHLTLDQARALAVHVPAGVARVAVFLRPAPEVVADVVRGLAPDLVQVDADAVEGLGLPAGQAVLPVVRDGESPARWPERLLYEGARSGTGERADWSRAAGIARHASLVLAGGLDASNVGDAVRAVRPSGVDVSSGVERTRGLKDPLMIRQFVEAARAAERRLAAEEQRR